MNNRRELKIPKAKLEAFCKKHHIKSLSFFGSVLRDDFGDSSDVDVLVEFDPKHVPGYIQLARIEEEFSRLIGGRRVDINTPKCLSRYFRHQVVADSKLVYGKK